MHRSHPRSPRAGRLAGALAFVAALAFTAAAAHANPITIGPGPALGADRAGVTWYEEFQDWTRADLKALDDVGAADALYLHGDGFDDSRDLAAFYYRAETQGNEPRLSFRVDLYDLALGAETSALDVYVAIDAAPGGQEWLPDYVGAKTDHPWELCVCVYQSGTTPGSSFNLYKSDFTTPYDAAYLGSYFNSQLDAVEFGIKRQALLDAGWDGVRPLTFQVFTTKDRGVASSGCTGGAAFGAGSKITDAFVDRDRGCSDGVLNGGILSTDAAGVVYVASIAHGNQSVNQAGQIGAHIYDPPSNTGISGGTGFLRTLDTHRLFHVPLNIHPSGTLTVAAQWAKRPGGAGDPQDGPSFLAEVRRFVDADQSDRPGSLIGGVFAEHILPYFEGAVNAASLALTDSLNQVVYGVSAADAKVMHTPERVIRSQDTGLSPLTGRTFADLAASPYQATVLDEVTHLHGWFQPGESCTPDAGYRHKVHRINGVYCFCINDREDQDKFGNFDGGAVMDMRFSLLQKALYGNSSEIVVVFDDWEALAGKSFDAASGNSVPNNNPNQYHTTIRWLANHPWVQVSNLKDLLALALADPAAFVIDHGYRYDLGIQTYEWLKHAAEDSYHHWYYDQDAGFTGNEQSFYDLVPVITGPQGDYRARGASPANDGPPLPSGMKHGDLNTPGTLLYETWQALQAAPAGRLRDLGVDAYLTMIYETAWHEEDALDYTDSDCYGAWLHPDASWDGVNTWALRLQNHVRQAGLYAAAARWVDSVRTSQPLRDQARAADLDFDGEPEYVLQSHRSFDVFERYGGRCVLAVAYNPVIADGVVVIGAPFTNPSAPGEEELTGAAATRCSAFKDMNDGAYADVPYAATLDTLYEGWRFTSPDGKVSKLVVLDRLLSLPEGPYFSLPFDILRANYTETVAGPLYVRVGLSPNPLDLAFHGQAHLQGWFPNARQYKLVNTQGGAALVQWAVGTAFDAAPASESGDRRNLGLTEEVELAGDGSFPVLVYVIPDTFQVLEAPRDPIRLPAAFSLAGPWPSPGRSGATATLELALPRAARVRLAVLDAAGRRVGARDLGVREAGRRALALEARDDAGRPLAAGLYFVRVEAGAERVQRRWVVLR